MVKILSILSLILLSTLVLFACSSGDEAKEPFVIAGIPDQNVSDLTRRYSGLTEYLSDELGVVVEYLPTTDYAATVTAFSRGDVQMAWFGGLTGVQARLAVPGSQAIAQRERDTKFHSVFVFNKNVDVVTLQDLKGLRFAFGSESSTSGHLMPRHFLSENGIDADSDFDGAPMFSGSHDQTWLLVQGGAADAGALSEAVWQKAVSTGKVDESKIGVFYVTPPYFEAAHTSPFLVTNIFPVSLVNNEFSSVGSDLYSDSLPLLFIDVIPLSCENQTELFLAIDILFAFIVGHFKLKISLLLSSLLIPLSVANQVVLF